MAARLPAPRRKEQLLDVALREFSSRGFHVTSMNEIADAAGVTKPVLYQHFPSKRALYLELLRTVGDRLMTAITKATAEAGNPREQVERGIKAYFLFVADHPDAYRLMFGGGTRRDVEFRDEALRVERSMAATIAPLITTEELGDTDRLLFAHGIVGLAEGTTRHWLNDGLEIDVSEIAARVADLAWRGLRNVGTDRRATSELGAPGADVG